MKTETTKAIRTARIFAEAVSVLCPHCGEAQPAPDNGSELWTIGNFQSFRDKTVTCSHCCKEMLIAGKSKAALPH